MVTSQIERRFQDGLAANARNNDSQVHKSFDAKFFQRILFLTGQTYFCITRNFLAYSAESSKYFADASLPGINLQALFRIDWRNRVYVCVCVWILRNISAGLGRDIGILIHATIFKCISSPGVLRRTRIRQKCQSCRASDCFACHRRRRAGRCALVFHRVTYLSILRRTIGFNEVEIENIMERACGLFGNKVNQHRFVLIVRPSLCVLRDWLPSPYYVLRL